MTTQTYRPLSNSGYTYETINRRLNRPTQIPQTSPYKPDDYGVAPTGQTTTYMDIYKPTEGQSQTSPVTGANIGMSQWGKPLTGALDPAQYGAVLNQNPYVTRVINDEMMRYYGSAPEVKLVDIVNKVVNEDMPLDQALTLMRSGHQRSEDEIRASSLVAGEYDPAVSALDRELDRIARELGININTQEGFGDKYGERISNIGDELARSLQGNQGAIEELYNRARQQTGEAYSQADEKMSQANSMIQQIMGESANQLGLGNAGDRSFSELAQALADSQGINAAGRAGAVGNFANLGADMSAIAQQSVSDSQREYAQYEQNLMNEVLRNIAQLQYQGAERQNEVGGQISDLERQRSADLRNTLLDVRDNRLDRERQTALDALAAEIQRGTLGLQRQQLGMNADQFDQTMGFNREQFEWEKERWRTELEAQLNQTQDPLEQAYLRAQIDNLNARTQDTLHGIANPTGGDAPTYKNLEGVQRWLSDNFSQPPYSSNADDMFFSTFNDMWQQAMTQSGQSTASVDDVFQSILSQQGLPAHQQNIYQTLAMIMANKYSG